jgi:hypothetical protein
VWRDDVQIATTTSTAYADTGLIASTTYTYYVTAYDTAFNESASSTEVSTTTLTESLPPPSTPSSTQQGARVLPFSEILKSVVVIPEMDGVRIRYETNTYFKGIVKIGKTSSYEIESSAERAYAKFHEISIAHLEPDTTYYFAIEGEARGRRYGSIFTGVFTTLEADDVFAPGNVRGLRAIQDRGDIILSWENPPDTDFEKVRVVRNNAFFPSDTVDGYVVYEGSRDQVRDAGAAQEAGVRYYSVFSYDVLGNVSSGAVLRVEVSRDGQVVADTSFPVDATKNEMGLTFEYVQFIQDGVPVSRIGDSVSVDGSKQLTVSIPYGVFPEHLKTILVVVRENQSKDARSFMFLLRVNREKTAYEGTLAPFGVSGYFPVQVSVFDYKTQQIGYVGGFIESTVTESVTTATRDGGELTIFIKKSIALILLLLGLYGLFLLARKRR